MRIWLAAPLVQCRFDSWKFKSDRQMLLARSIGYRGRLRPWLHRGILYLAGP